MRALAVLLGFVAALLSSNIATAQLTHPELLSRDGVPESDRVAPLSPITIGTRSFYAYGADVLEWSEAKRAVISRVRMPARIAAIAPSDSAMKVTLMVPGLSRERVDVIWKLDGPKPGRGYWGFIDTFRTRREARAIAFGFDPERGDIDVAKRDEAIAALAAREQVDLGNPFLAAVRGQLLVRAGRAEEAKQAFTAAADLRGAVFDDLLRLSVLLEDENQSELAQRAFDRGFEGMKQAGLRPEVVEAVVAMQVFMGVPRRALAAALAAGDTARVDRIESRYFSAFPRVEGAHVAYRDLALWMESRGRADLAAVWSARASAAEGSAANRAAGDVRAIDRLNILALGAAVIAPLVAFVVGLRRGAGRGRNVVVDVLTALAPIVLLLVAATISTARVDALGRAAVMPTALLSDASASPDVLRFFDRLNPSAERDALIAWSKAEADATKAGGRSESALPAGDFDATIVAAVQKPAWGAAFAGAVRPSRDHAPLTPSLVVLMCGAAALFGFFVGGRAPRAAVAASRVIPGGPASLGIVGPVLGAIFVAALFAFAGADRALASLVGTHPTKW
ncbi:MAG: hypothetical protein ACXWUG_31760, partial [Polyangiales bacterium]